MRYPEPLRDSVADIRSILLTAPGGEQVPLEQPGAHRAARRAGADQSRDGQAPHRRRRQCAGPRPGRLRRRTAAESRARRCRCRPATTTNGAASSRTCSARCRHLTIIVPITIGAIFFLLFLLFHSLRFAALIILVLPFASIGGVVGALRVRRVPVGAGVGWLHRSVGHRRTERRCPGLLHPQTCAKAA